MLLQVPVTQTELSGSDMPVHHVASARAAQLGLEAPHGRGSPTGLVSGYCLLAGSLGASVSPYMGLTEGCMGFFTAYWLGPKSKGPNRWR